MIAKTFLTSQGFGETCQYLCEEQTRAEVLAVNGVRPYDWKKMAADFEWQHGLMPEKEKPVYHAALSFPAGEQVTDERLVELGQRFLEKIEVVNTQYAFVKHTDTGHLHMHILANRVNNDGEPTAKGLVIERGIKAAAELTAEYGLRQEEGKRLDRTHREALHEPDEKRYRIYEAIQEQLPFCRGLDDLEKRLLQEGIAVRYRRDPETGTRQGISFRLEDRSFKGSRVDKLCSLKELERTLSLQQELRQEPALFEGKEFVERMRLMRVDGLREKEEERVEEMKKEMVLKQAMELQREESLQQGMRMHRGLSMGRGF